MNAARVFSSRRLACMGARSFSAFYSEAGAVMTSPHEHGPQGNRFVETVNLFSLVDGIAGYARGVAFGDTKSGRDVEQCRALYREYAAFHLPATGLHACNMFGALLYALVRTLHRLDSYSCDDVDAILCAIAYVCELQATSLGSRFAVPAFFRHYDSTAFEHALKRFCVQDGGILTSAVVKLVCDMTARTILGCSVPPFSGPEAAGASSVSLDIIRELAAFRPDAAAHVAFFLQRPALKEAPPRKRKAD